jgi:hypothetical protein
MRAILDRLSRAVPEASRRAELARAAAPMLFGLIPAVVTVWLLELLLRRHNLAIDVTGWYWPGGERVLDGLSPYSLPATSALNYPAVGAVLLVPLAILPRDVAAWTCTIVVILSIPVTLRILGVRDWRIFGALMLWQPVMVGWLTANVSVLVALALAIAWRYRDRPRVTGAVIALIVSVKLFLLPLAIWLIVTRRYRALAWAAGVTVVANAIAWAVLGFDQLTVYAHLIRVFARTAEHRGYSLISILLHLGAGEAAAFCIGIGAAAITVLAGLRAIGTRRDHAVFTCCLTASLLASPVVEAHYLALLIVPLAIARPSMSAVWLLPLLLLVAPADHPAIWQNAIVLAVFSVVIATLLLHRAAPAPLVRPRQVRADQAGAGA